MADAHGSGPCGGNTLRVQVPSPARRVSKEEIERFLLFLFSVYACNILSAMLSNIDVAQAVSQSGFIPVSNGLSGRACTDS